MGNPEQNNAKPPPKISDILRLVDGMRPFPADRMRLVATDAELALWAPVKDRPAPETRPEMFYSAVEERVKLQTTWFVRPGHSVVANSDLAALFAWVSAFTGVIEVIEKAEDAALEAARRTANGERAEKAR